MAWIKRVTIRKFSELSGYTQEAVRAKIKTGVWLQGQVWIKAPDGRILIDMEAYESWVDQGSVLPQHRPLKSTSTIAA